MLHNQAPQRRRNSVRWSWLLFSFLLVAAAQADDFSIASFQIDVTPPLGSPLCDALVPPAAAVDDPLSARGLVFLPENQQPIVLVAVDWVGIGNEGHDAWRDALAQSVDTDIDRVCVHALHQHDAPGCDFLADRIAAEVGLGSKLFNVDFARRAIANAAEAAADSLVDAQAITHISLGQAKVEKVASNRRLLGPDGKVQHVRYTACRDPAIRALPEGTIDPMTKVVGLWSEETPVAVLTYYATHPQSYYQTQRISADFVGLARAQREDELHGPLHIHFNGAGGNIGAGKYNDGSPENRPVLAKRLARGMRQAWDANDRVPVTGLDVDWKTEEVTLPIASHMDELELRSTLENDTAAEDSRLRAARDLAWLQRCNRGHPITLGRLRIGPVDILHLPGELFVEYQLAAQQMRPESLVCVAAYGDYGPGYIGLAMSYDQGGYETGPVSRVSPRVESVLMEAIGDLLK